jgi:hypothetical protein
MVSAAASTIHNGQDRICRLIARKLANRDSARTTDDGRPCSRAPLLTAGAKATLSYTLHSWCIHAGMSISSAHHRVVLGNGRRLRVAHSRSIRREGAVHENQWSNQQPVVNAALDPLVLESGIHSCQTPTNSGNFHSDIAAIARIKAVPHVLEVICRTAGMGIVAVARVTESWRTCCEVCDEIQFGLQPRDELRLASTICNEIRVEQKVVVIEEVGPGSILRPASYSADLRRLPELHFRSDHPVRWHVLRNPFCI